MGINHARAHLTLRAAAAAGVPRRVIARSTKPARRPRDVERTPDGPVHLDVRGTSGAVRSVRAHHAAVKDARRRPCEVQTRSVRAVRSTRARQARLRARPSATPPCLVGWFYPDAAARDRPRPRHAHAGRRWCMSGALSRPQAMVRCSMRSPARPRGELRSHDRRPCSFIHTRERVHSRDRRSGPGWARPHPETRG